MSEHFLNPKSVAEKRNVSAEGASPAARPPLRRSDLFESDRMLVELMEDLNFGRIEGLKLRDGRPVLQPLPRVIAAVRMTSEDRNSDSKPRSGSDLRQSVSDLIALIRRIGDGEVFLIEVRHGLPFSVEVEWLGNR
jgi:hypothetical protein